MAKFFLEAFMYKKMQGQPQKPVVEWRSYLRVTNVFGKTLARSLAEQRETISNILFHDSTIPVGREYIDEVYGTADQRTSFQQMVEDARSGLFSHLAIVSPDRFCRNPAEAIATLRVLRDSGIKVRTASSPNLDPETDDGFFMFFIQSGIVQQDVDVLRSRTVAGMHEKLLAGGWIFKAPDGYLNRECVVSRNKFERGIVSDPDRMLVIRTAWEFLLTEKFNLDEICLELTRLGYTRSSGQPWSWEDPQTGKTHSARTALHRIFQNPFYAGWVTSERFGIKRGQVRGTWEPVVTNGEFERGLKIISRQKSDKH
jgi:DNA invertase Pin-like site-specific DNA recombinase